MFDCRFWPSTLLAAVRLLLRFSAILDLYFSLFILGTQAHLLGGQDLAVRRRYLHFLLLGWFFSIKEFTPAKELFPLFALLLRRFADVPKREILVRAWQSSLRRGKEFSLPKRWVANQVCGRSDGIGKLQSMVCVCWVRGSVGVSTLAQMKNCINTCMDVKKVVIRERESNEAFEKWMMIRIKNLL